jgi:hypothetical protein
LPFQGKLAILKAQFYRYLKEEYSLNTENRVEKLANQFDEVVQNTINLINRCSSAEWSLWVPQDERSVGVLFHHIAYSIPIVMNWILTAATKELLPIFNPEDGIEFNEFHAQKFAQTSKAETLALLKENYETAKTSLRNLTDEQLDYTSPFIQPYRTDDTLPADMVDIRVQQLIEWNLLHHPQDHLEAIIDVLRID